MADPARLISLILAGYLVATLSATGNAKLFTLRRSGALLAATEEISDGLARVIITVVGVVELTLCAVAVACPGSTVFSVATASLFAAFAAYHVRRASGPGDVRPCSCAGASPSPAQQRVGRQVAIGQAVANVGLAAGAMVTSALPVHSQAQWVFLVIWAMPAVRALVSRRVPAAPVL